MLVYTAVIAEETVETESTKRRMGFNCGMVGDARLVEISDEPSSHLPG